MKTLNPLYHSHYNKKECDEATDRSTWNGDVFRFGNRVTLVDFDYCPELHKVTIPTLVIAGQEDFITPPVHSEEIAAAMPNAELHVIQDAAHETYDDQPEEYFKLVKEYILKMSEE